MLDFIYRINCLQINDLRIMHRSHIYFLSRGWRSTQLMQFSGFHTSQSLRFSTTPCYQESHDYIGSLYTKLSHQEEYSFLDPNISSHQSIMQDTKLISSPEFKSFLNILANAESETSDDNIDVNIHSL